MIGIGRQGQHAGHAVVARGNDDLQPGQLPGEIGAAIKAGQGRTDSNRIQRELELAWFGQQFQWKQGKNGWQVTGLGLGSTPPEGKQP